MPNPICPEHGTEMRPSKYGKGQFYCGKKNEDGSYCKQKATLTAEVAPGKPLPGPPAPSPQLIKDSPDKEHAIARAVALKGAIDLAVGGKIDTKELLSAAEKFEGWLNR